jgi:hypothetical protein
MPYSITSSARRRIDCGMVSPRVFAVFKLISSWNLVGRTVKKLKLLLLGQERYVHMRLAQALVEALSLFGGFL